MIGWRNIFASRWCNYDIYQQGLIGSNANQPSLIFFPWLLSTLMFSFESFSQHAIMNFGIVLANEPKQHIFLCADSALVNCSTSNCLKLHRRTRLVRSSVSAQLTSCFLCLSGRGKGRWGKMMAAAWHKIKQLAVETINNAHILELLSAYRTRGI